MHILSIIVFLVLIALTLVITARAAKKVKTDKDFYAAGGEIPGWRPGKSWITAMALSCLAGNRNGSRNYRIFLNSMKAWMKMACARIWPIS